MVAGGVGHRLVRDPSVFSGLLCGCVIATIDHLSRTHGPIRRQSCVDARVRSRLVASSDRRQRSPLGVRLGQARGEKVGLPEGRPRACRGPHRCLSSRIPGGRIPTQRRDSRCKGRPDRTRPNGDVRTVNRWYRALGTRSNPSRVSRLGCLSRSCRITVTPLSGETG